MYFDTAMKDRLTEWAQTLNENGYLRVKKQTADRVPFCSYFKGYKIVQDVHMYTKFNNVFRRVVITIDKIS